MKNWLFVLIWVGCMSWSQAQGIVTIRTSGTDKFFAFVNGQQWNEVPLGEVKLTCRRGDTLWIYFQDRSLPPVDMSAPEAGCVVSLHGFAENGKARFAPVIDCQNATSPAAVPPAATPPVMQNVLQVVEAIGEQIIRTSEQHRRIRRNWRLR